MRQFGMRDAGARRRFAAFGLGVLLSITLAACAAIEPKPLVVQNLGRRDQVDRTGEAARLTSQAGVWRTGDILTVDTEEGIQFRFVDAGTCDGFDQCRRWSFEGKIAAQGGQRRQDYWLVSLEQGEGGYWLALGRGSGSVTTLNTKPYVSPRADRWATGECNDLSGSSLSIYEAGDYGAVSLAAEVPDGVDCCEIEGWDGAALKVRLCDSPQGDKPLLGTPDRLVRAADGAWVGARVRLTPKG